MLFELHYRAFLIKKILTADKNLSMKLGIIVLYRISQKGKLSAVSWLPALICPPPDFFESDENYRKETLGTYSVNDISLKK